MGTHQLAHLPAAGKEIRRRAGYFRMRLNMSNIIHEEVAGPELPRPVLPQCPGNVQGRAEVAAH
jgi:hypothetical protein